MVMVHNTLEHQAKIARGTDVPTSREMETAWVLTAHSALRSDRTARGPAETGQDRARPRGTTTEALMALEDAALAAAVAAERVFSFAEVLNEALAVLAEAGSTHPAVPGPSSRNPAPGGAVLSPRERQVLALVAEGRTNKAIADVLCVSPNTIKTHVTSLLTKLHADSRVQLAAIAARQGLG